MPVTLKDVARQSGFSVTQVSRALAGYDDVSARTREHIKKVAAELGYQPNYVARQLQSQRTNTIGFVMPADLNYEQDNLFNLLLKGITHTAAKKHYDVLVTAVESPSEQIDVYKRIAGGKRVDGMILARTYKDDPRIEYLQSIKFPFIVHGRLAPDAENDFSYIDMDSQEGIALATQHLVETGHQTIGIILPPENAAFTAYRLAGYRQAIETITTLEDRLCIHGDLSYEGGQAAARELFDRNPDLTAIVGCNDWMALGAMSIAKEKSYRVGENFAIVGYDNIPPATYSDPSLTTVHQPTFEIGTQLAEALIAAVTNKQPTVELTQRLIQPTLIVRESSGKSPQRREPA